MQVSESAASYYSLYLLFVRHYSSPPGVADHHRECVRGRGRQEEGDAALEHRVELLDIIKHVNIYTYKPDQANKCCHRQDEERRETI